MFVCSWMQKRFHILKDPCAPIKQQTVIVSPFVASGLFSTRYQNIFSFSFRWLFACIFIYFLIICFYCTIALWPRKIPLHVFSVVFLLKHSCVISLYAHKQDLTAKAIVFLHYKYTRVNSSALDSSLWNIKSKWFLRGRTCFCWFVAWCSIVSEVWYILF